MEFQNQNGVAEKNGAAKENNKNVSQPVDVKKPGTKNSASEKTAPNDKPDTPADSNAPVAIAQPVSAEQPKETAAAPKPVLSLESKLKLVEDLYRRSIQRNNLIGRIQQLEDFEVNLATEHDELEENPYQGCKLIIEDDKQRRFITTTPGLIRLVSQFIYEACNRKLEEIEATINFPNA
ncbi:hypothetical protein [Mucilaginibacter paludis]|uniref:Uncharacterized protein n=1 Tax=Mucilaginibacter paludis DSM 18603 TaxID=714943 RepID=H1Y3I9_9SPHI|nr:hypothetical protein [Mucilaginibacter paludis]EHQ29757.1 hypothetical protein Mucpa_5688 [Mucilaginibacter paludis DSM 18603]